MAFFLNNNFNSQLRSADQNTVIDLNRLFSFDVADFISNNFTIVATQIVEVDISRLTAVKGIIVYGDNPFDISISTDTGGDAFTGKDHTRVALFPTDLPDQLKIRAGANDVDVSLLVAG